MVMRRVTDLIESLGDDKVYYTLEYFPPKTSDGLNNLINRIHRMVSNLNPSCIHITWNPSSSDTSLDLIELIQSRFLVPCCLHLTCTNIQTSQLDQTLMQAKELGIVNILALRGDPPRGTESWVPTDQKFQHAIDLVRYIRKKFGDWFCIGVAGYPEASLDSSNKPDPDREMSYLVQKVEAGAEFIVTQLFYDAENFISWYDRCRRIGIKVPILPGIMPIQTYQGFRRLTALCKTKIPESVQLSLNSIKTDDRAVGEYGIKLSLEIIREIQSKLSVKSFYLSTLNLEKSITKLVDHLGWNLRTETTASSDLQTSNPELILNKLYNPEFVQGVVVGSNRSITWDEFPNGRFSDSRSPAFDLEKIYGSQSIGKIAESQQWGLPTTVEEITEIFYSFSDGKIPLIPWSEEPLALETSPISPFLLKLNRAGLWTVGSQPAVDGVDSTDPAFGFGPVGGRIYQKAFVEFFIDERDVERVIGLIESQRDSDGINQFRYYAGNSRSGDVIRTNVSRGEKNSVTWGVFANAEVVTTTHIEESSFKTWKEEAFEIWNQWAELCLNNKDEPKNVTNNKEEEEDRMSKKRKSYELLKDMNRTRWLFSIVNHDYKDKFELWNFLIDEIL
ncbi:methylenetetrahydrofolate reductase-domain-containing protein [Phakopsora pachyrhizi]|nr:methylenetetrahydrofolate reductase-domain-containing protein [Phakopsora pachyrhizi]